MAKSKLESQESLTRKIGKSLENINAQVRELNRGVIIKRSRELSSREMEAAVFNIYQRIHVGTDGKNIEPLFKDIRVIIDSAVESVRNHFIRSETECETLRGDLREFRDRESRLVDDHSKKIEELKSQHKLQIKKIESDYEKERVKLQSKSDEMADLLGRLLCTVRGKPLIEQAREGVKEVEHELG